MNLHQGTTSTRKESSSAMILSRLPFHHTIKIQRMLARKHQTLFSWANLFLTYATTRLLYCTLPWARDGALQKCQRRQKEHLLGQKLRHEDDGTMARRLRNLCPGNHSTPSDCFLRTPPTHYNVTRAAHQIKKKGTNNNGKRRRRAAESKRPKSST